MICKLTTKKILTIFITTRMKRTVIKLITLVFLLSSKTIWAQMPNDALMMPKGTVCNLLQGSYSQFDNYWEGTVFRNNPNMGTFQSQSLMLMSNWGVTNKLNLMAGLPFISNRGTASYIQPQRNIQDLSLFVKYQILDKKLGFGNAKIFATGSVSTPLSNYSPELLPFSIGLRCPTAALRLVANVTSDFGLYLTAHTAHSWRGSVKLQRDAFLFDGVMYNTDVAPVPNVVDGGVVVGFIKPRFQAEIRYEKMQSLTGDDMRYNDAPFLTNQMIGDNVAAMVKYYVTKRLAVNAVGSQVVSGRNVGKATMGSLGVSYILGKLRTDEKN
jgi:hypothetical protein